MGGYVCWASLALLVAGLEIRSSGRELRVLVVSLTLVGKGVGKGVGKFAREFSVCVSVGWLTSSGSRFTDFSLGRRGVVLENDNYD